MKTHMFSATNALRIDTLRPKAIPRFTFCVVTYITIFRRPNKIKGGGTRFGGQLLEGFRIKNMQPGREISAAMHEREEVAAAYEPRY